MSSDTSYESEKSLPNNISDLRTYKINLIQKFKKFNKIFEKRLSNIDHQTKFNSKNIELKYPILEEWIENLKQQNHVLLEIAETHVANDEYIAALESDLKNVQELLRRARVEKQWNVDGLEFLTLTCEHLLGPEINHRHLHASNSNVKDDTTEIDEANNESIFNVTHYSGRFLEFSDEGGSTSHASAKD